MEGILWYVLAGTRGGENRCRILRALDERPRNAHQLAEDLDLNYKTVTHHLDRLEEHDVITRRGEDYGAVYLPSDDVRDHWETVAEITGRIDGVETVHGAKGYDDGNGNGSGDDGGGNGDDWTGGEDDEEGDG